ncbi:hypothetical protein [Paenibacillus lignilyticus]|uniref:Uncharacterized protein n=1 Tax=Paenibacillus lignilyticus TaxID=1172615 RepID=A0ABS5CK56_9BACL|nr:hypothetical protein [Paenibacillus lignilyticus]MBP3966254.1 hypothetical protein [Paenibacillus lignilyticus]
MSTALNLFPVLSDELMVKIGFEAGNYEFKYHINGLEHPLTSSSYDTQARLDNIQISDERSEWTPDIHDLSIKRTYTINNPVFLFGVNGIVAEDAEIGIALMWASKTSNQRGVKVIGGIRKNSGGIVFDFETVFPPGQLKGSMGFETILFLKEPGLRKDTERHLANSTGITLGSLDICHIIIDGNGSVFPIVEVEEKSQPLWWVKCDWTDPMGDRFEEENVRICINKAHPNYSLLKLEDGFKESPLLIDIIASALQIIIQKVKESEFWNEIVSGQNFESGSVAEAINYFLNTFNWNPYSPEDLALSIRRDFDSRI